MLSLIFFLFIVAKFSYSILNFLILFLLLNLEGIFVLFILLIYSFIFAIIILLAQSLRLRIQNFIILFIFIF